MGAASCGQLNRKQVKVNLRRDEIPQPPTPQRELLSAAFRSLITALRRLLWPEFSPASPGLRASHSCQSYRSFPRSQRLPAARHCCLLCVSPVLTTL